MKKQPSSYRVPARGPIRCNIDFGATPEHCGVRYEVRLDRKQSEIVRRGAKLVGMEPLAFIFAVFDSSVPHAERLPYDNVALAARAAGLRLLCEHPAFLARIERAAAYHGHASAQDYLMDSFCLSLALDELEVIINPATGQPAGNSAFWQEVRKILGVDRPRYVADPLNHPGFLDRFKDSDPFTFPVGAPMVFIIGDERLNPDLSQAKAA